MSCINHFSLRHHFFASNIRTMILFWQRARVIHFRKTMLWNTSYLFCFVKKIDGIRNPLTKWRKILFSVIYFLFTIRNTWITQTPRGLQGALVPHIKTLRVGEFLLLKNSLAKWKVHGLHCAKGNLLSD